MSARIDGAHPDVVLMLGHAKAVVVGIVVVLAAGCGASSNSSSTSTQSSTTPTTSGSPAATNLFINGKHSTLAFTPAATSQLHAAGISLAAIAPATIAKPALVNLPVYVGEVAIPGLTGTISHQGGLTFTHAGKSVSATDFVLNTAESVLTA